ncbi:MAG TPA: AraC family transcriptional regulator [Kiritimatiellia bacterium]|nr:AraC family transcriptional regulator [Kiritimatiellia bacterium]
MESPLVDNYYENAPLPGGRVVDRVRINGEVEPWPTNNVRYVSRRWLGPVSICTQGIELPVGYLGTHEHIGRGRYPMHTHPHAEIIYTLNGKGSINFPERNLIELCEPGHVIAIPPACAHQTNWNIEHEDEHWFAMVINFDISIDAAQMLVEVNDAADMAFTPFYEWFFMYEGSGFNVLGADREEIDAIMDQISKSLTNPRYGVCPEIIAGLLKVISIFSRHIRQEGLASGANMLSPCMSKSGAILKARSMMNGIGFLDAGCVARVAKEVGISESYFIREFKRKFGITPKQYAVGVLMKRAAALMGRTDISVKDACYQLGFTDPSTFTKAFTRFHGMTPTAFHKRAVQNLKQT